MSLHTRVEALIASLNAIDGLPDVDAEGDEQVILERSGFYWHGTEINLQYELIRPVAATTAEATLSFALTQRLEDLQAVDSTVMAATAMVELLKKFGLVYDKLAADATTGIGGMTGEIPEGSAFFSMKQNAAVVNFQILMRAFQ